MELIRILGERLDRLNRGIEKVLIVFVCALVCVITYEVIVRYFFGRPVIWARDVAVWLYGAHFLLPVAYHYACNRQICASDLIYNLRLTDRQRAAIDLVSNAFLAALAILLFTPAVNRMLVAVRFDERSIMTLWRPPLWPYFLLIPTMLVLVGLQALRAVVQATLVLGKSGDAA
jgi:TRAP-type mannitol/chloroaromatic compound transport system permease small subunit